MKSIIAVILFVSISTLNAQVAQQWVSRYNGPRDTDEPKAMAVDAAGNVHVTGQSTGAGTNGTLDYLTVKYNSSGDSLWAKRYQSAPFSSDVARAIRVDDQGSVYVTGVSNADYATIKYSVNGDSLWAKTFNGPAFFLDGANDLFVDPARNVYVTGGVTNSNYDFGTLKYRSNGTFVWSAYYNGPGNNDDIGYKVTVDRFGNVYVTGTRVVSGFIPFTDIVTVKYDSTGIQRWAKIYDGPGGASDYPVGIAVDSLGNVYVGGTASVASFGSNYVVIKYASNGDSLWARRYNGGTSNGNGAAAFVIDASGNSYITGTSYSSNTNADYATLKYSPNGDSLWASRFLGRFTTSSDAAASLAVDNSGNVFVTGTSGDYETVKYSSSGVQQWAAYYDGPAGLEDDPVSIALDPAGNIYVTGRSQGVGTAYDYATVKYSQTTGVNDPPDDVPSEYSLSQNYPNPFNPTTEIRYQISEVSHVTLNVYDILGREMATLVHEVKRPGAYTVRWDATRFASGVYFYRLQAGSFIETKKLILLR